MLRLLAFFKIIIMKYLINLCSFFKVIHLGQPVHDYRLAQFSWWFQIACKLFIISNNMQNKNYIILRKYSGIFRRSYWFFVIGTPCTYITYMCVDDLEGEFDSDRFPGVRLPKFDKPHHPNSNFRSRGSRRCLVHPIGTSNCFIEYRSLLTRARFFPRPPCPLVNEPTVHRGSFHVYFVVINLLFN